MGSSKSGSLSMSEVTAGSSTLDAVAPLQPIPAKWATRRTARILILMSGGDLEKLDCRGDPAAATVINATVMNKGASAGRAATAARNRPHRWLRLQRWS